MSTTLTLPFVRFVKQYHTEPAANTSYLATLARAVEGLKTAPWKEAEPGTLVETPISNSVLSFESDAYDAFKSSGDAVPNSGKQAVYVGMVAYRFKLPDDALVATTAKVKSIVLTAYADKFNWKGLLISAYLSNSYNPPTDWDTLAAGDIATAITDGVGILPEANPATKTATNKSGIVTLTYVVNAEPKAYLYIIVQLANWLVCKYEYWVEGSGMIDGSTLLVEFDRSVTPDVAADEDILLITTNGNIIAPAMNQTSVESATLREVVHSELTFSSELKYSGMSSTEPLSAIPLMFARIADSGASQVDTSKYQLLETRKQQLGLSCSICSRVVHAVPAFEHKIVFTYSPIAVEFAFPIGFTPIVANISHRVGENSITVSGCVITLAAYWIASKPITLAQLGALAASTNAAYGERTITVGNLTANRVGSISMPTVLSGGDTMSMKLSGTFSRWGTLIIVPYVSRITATELAVDIPIGLTGLSVRENLTEGIGWLPNISLEKKHA